MKNVVLRLQEAAAEADPFHTAIVSKDILHEAVGVIEARARGEDRAEFWVFILSCVCVGLLVAMLWTGSKLDTPPNCPAPRATELAGDPEVMQLDPLTIKANGGPVYEL